MCETAKIPRIPSIVSSGSLLLEVAAVEEVKVEFKLGGGGGVTKCWIGSAGVWMGLGYLDSLREGVGAGICAKYSDMELSLPLFMYMVAGDHRSF